MSKIDLSAIVADVQKLYNKDKRSRDMITAGAPVRKVYTEKDGILIPEGHPLRELTGLVVAPFNKILQVAGPPDSGKSTIAGQLMASAQKYNHTTLLWDAEDKFDANRYDTKFGGDSDNILYVKTNEILQGGEKLRKLTVAVKNRYPQQKLLLVWDSVGGSQSRGAAERELDNEKHAQPGQDAKENGAVMKMFVDLFNKYPDSITVLLINQVYDKIGFMQKGTKASGGKKLEFHSSLIINLKNIKTLTKIVNKKEMKYGITTQATVTKNHLAQGDTSLHKLDFDITASGAHVSTVQSEGDDE